MSTNNATKNRSFIQNEQEESLQLSDDPHQMYNRDHLRRNARRFNNQEDNNSDSIKSGMIYK